MELFNESSLLDFLLHDEVTTSNHRKIKVPSCLLDWESKTRGLSADGKKGKNKTGKQNGKKNADKIFSGNFSNTSGSSISNVDSIDEEWNNEVAELVCYPISRSMKSKLKQSRLSDKEAAGGAEVMNSIPKKKESFAQKLNAKLTLKDSKYAQEVSQSINVEENEDIINKKGSVVRKKGKNLRKNLKKPQTNIPNEDIRKNTDAKEEEGKKTRLKTKEVNREQEAKADAPDDVPIAKKKERKRKAAKINTEKPVETPERPTESNNKEERNSEALISRDMNRSESDKCENSLNEEAIPKVSLSKKRRNRRRKKLEKHEDHQHVENAAISP